MEEKLTLTKEWDKTFPQSDKVNHRKEWKTDRSSDACVRQRSG